jgi:precorrin-2 methylase
LLSPVKGYLERADELDLTARSVLISRCGLDGEEIVRNLKDRDNTAPPYMSLLIIRKKGADSMKGT